MRRCRNIIVLFSAERVRELKMEVMGKKKEKIVWKTEKEKLAWRMYKMRTNAERAEKFGWEDKRAVSRREKERGNIEDNERV